MGIDFVDCCTGLCGVKKFQAFLSFHAQERVYRVYTSLNSGIVMSLYSDNNRTVCMDDMVNTTVWPLLNPDEDMLLQWETSLGDLTYLVYISWELSIHLV